MPTTRDHPKLGQTVWHVQIFGDDGDDPWAKTLATAELSTLAVAKRWTRAAVNHWRTQVAEGWWVWAQLVAGTYQDASFTDPTDGLVRHASWEPSDTDRYTTGLTDSGQVPLPGGLTEMTSSERSHLHPVPDVDHRPKCDWTELGRRMGYTNTVVKRRAILRAAERLDFTTPYAYWRLQQPHLAAVAAAALAGAQLRRAALTEVAGRAGWTLLVLDEEYGTRQFLLDFGAEAIHVLLQHPRGA